MQPRAARLALIAVLSLAGCDLEGGEEADTPVLGEHAAALGAWTVMGGLPLGERRVEVVGVGDRDAWPVWVSGSTTRPVALHVEATGADGAAVQLSVLGPLVNGS